MEGAVLSSLIAFIREPLKAPVLFEWTRALSSNFREMEYLRNRPSRRTSMRPISTSLRMCHVRSCRWMAKTLESSPCEIPARSRILRYVLRERGFPITENIGTSSSDSRFFGEKTQRPPCLCLVRKPDRPSLSRCQVALALDVRTARATSPDDRHGCRQSSTKMARLGRLIMVVLLSVVVVVWTNPAARRPSKALRSLWPRPILLSARSFDR